MHTARIPDLRHAAGVSMFCAALLLSCPCVEISIYSTCKRISQKILRNVMKFASMIADQDMATINCKILKENSEEIYLQGPLGKTDVRIINSYPSKVCSVNQKAGWKCLAKVGKSRVAKVGKSRVVKVGKSRKQLRDSINKGHSVDDYTYDVRRHSRDLSEKNSAQIDVRLKNTTCYLRFGTQSEKKDWDWRIRISLRARRCTREACVDTAKTDVRSGPSLPDLH